MKHWIALVLMMPLPLSAAEVPLSQLSAYLSKLTVAEADFSQTNADGSLSKGRILINRPGLARFEYAAPDRTLVVASGGTVAVFDGKSDGPPQEYPLAKTPLNLILGRSIDLGNNRMVVDHAEIDGKTHVTAQDPDHPDYGSLELIFDEDPVALSGWIVTDDGGSQTLVTLGPLKTDASIPASLFSIEAEKKKRGTQP